VSFGVADEARGTSIPGESDSPGMVKYCLAARGGFIDHLITVEAWGAAPIVCQTKSNPGRKRNGLFMSRLKGVCRRSIRPGAHASVKRFTGREKEKDGHISNDEGRRWNGKLASKFARTPRRNDRNRQSRKSCKNTASSRSERGS